MAIRGNIGKVVTALLGVWFVIEEVPAVRRTLGVITGFDFLYERYNDPGWLGGVLKMALNPPPGTALVVALIGLVLIYWSTKPKVIRMSWPVLGMLISFVGVAGFGVWYLVANQPVEQHLAPEKVVIHDPPSADDIAEAVAPIERQLKAVSQQRDNALSEIAALRRQIENAPNPVKGRLPPPNPVEYRRLSRDQMGVIIDEFSNVTDIIPKVLLSKADDVRGEANQYMRDFMEAFERAGTRYETLSQKPNGPKQTGVMISVHDMEKPPAVALKTQAILRDAGIVAPIVPLPPELNNLPAEFTIFIGPNPL